MRHLPLILATMLIMLSFPVAAFVGAVPSLILWLTGAGYAYADVRRNGV